MRIALIVMSLSLNFCHAELYKRCLNMTDPSYIQYFARFNEWPSSSALECAYSAVTKKQIATDFSKLVNAFFFDGKICKQGIIPRPLQIQVTNGEILPDPAGHVMLLPKAVSGGSKFANNTFAYWQLNNDLSFDNWFPTTTTRLHGPDSITSSTIRFKIPSPVPASLGKLASFFDYSAHMAYDVVPPIVVSKMTVSFWALISDPLHITYVVNVLDAGLTGVFYGFDLQGGLRQLFRYGQYDSFFYKNPPSHPTNVWTYMSFTYEIEGEYKAYWNGAADFQGSTAGFNCGPISQIFLCDYCFSVSLASVEIYLSVLNQTEIIDAMERSKYYFQ